MRELNPAGLAWSNLKRSLANLAKRSIAQTAALARTRLAQHLAAPDDAACVAGVIAPDDQS
jgi:hypothetical protein